MGWGLAGVGIALAAFAGWACTALPRTLFDDQRARHGDLPFHDRYDEVDGSEVRLGDGACSWGPSCGSPIPSVTRTYAPADGAEPLGCAELRDLMAPWADDGGGEMVVQEDEPCTLTGRRGEGGYDAPWRIVAGPDDRLVVTIGDRDPPDP